MIRKMPYRLVPVLLAICLVGAGISPPYGACASVCCEKPVSPGCHDAAIPELPSLSDGYRTEIKAAPCDMREPGPFEVLRGANSTSPRPERFAAAVYGIVAADNLPSLRQLGLYASRILAVSRAEPSPLFLRNLSLLF